ncbi:MAG: hypothetical protein K8H87_16000 [Pseudorhodoplanes sp.]|nr:hypothetical protein [Pseudorhodoplanes sp.]
MRKLLMTGVAVTTLPVMLRHAAARKAAARTVTGAAVGRGTVGASAGGTRSAGAEDGVRLTSSVGPRCARANA